MKSDALVTVETMDIDNNITDKCSISMENLPVVIKNKFIDPKYVFNSWINELRLTLFWKSVGAEFLGTGILVFFGLGSTITFPNSVKPTVGQISMAFGFAAGTAIWILGHLSNAHINPAVTIGTLITRRITLLRALLFIIAQCGGSIAATYILGLLTPKNVRGNLGATLLRPGVTVIQGVYIELLITYVLVMCFFATTDDKRADLNGSGALAIGLSIVIGHLVAINYTGASMNPAVSLGPAVVVNIWTNFWVYIAGPVSGGVLAALMYEHIFAVNASWKKLKSYLTHSRYEYNEF